MAKSNSNIDLNASCVNYNNVSQGIIHITEDKLHVILLEYEKKNKKFYSWTTPLGIFISCLIATITSNFKEKWGLSPDTWMAIFVLITVCSGIWFVCVGWSAFMNRKNVSVEKLIEQIKNKEAN